MRTPPTATALVLAAAAGQPATPTPDDAPWWSEDAEGANAWTASGTGGDDLHTFDATAAHAGTKGILLATRLTGATTGDVVHYERELALPADPLQHLHAWTKVLGEALTGRFLIALEFYTGVNIWKAHLEYDFPVPGAFVITYGEETPILPTVTPGHAQGTWLPWDLWIDTSTWTYRRAAMAGHSAELKPLKMSDLGETAETKLIVRIDLYNATNARTTAHLDDLSLALYHDP